MLYHLLTPLADSSSFFNLFRYTTFRTAWGTVTALALCYLMFPRFIAWLKMKKMEQIIRDDGPQSHIEAKVGTPTMGGLVMVFSITFSTLMWARLDQPVVWMVLAVFNGYAAIGFIDDWKKVMHRSSDGLAGRWKMAGQFGIAGVVFGLGYHYGVVEPDLALPFLKDGTVHFDELIPGFAAFGWAYVLFAMVVCNGASNAVNLTDGLDGLAIGPVMTSAVTLGVLAYAAGTVTLSEYLAVPYVAGASELMVFGMIIVGAGLGFLWYNSYPASVFMGDVGSLALGGALGSMAVLSKHELLLALVGGVFVLEALSVMIQVFSFKTTGKRVFRMAPIHHHYEKLGWSEPKIIVRFWIISVLLALVALSTVKIR